MIDTREDFDNLPQGWSWTKIGEICELINGKAFKSEDWSSNGLPIIRIQNLNNHNAEFNYYDLDVEDKYIVEHGQLLFAWSGTPGTSFGAHIWKRGKGVLNQHIFKVNINDNYLNKKYLKHIINHNVSQYIKKAHGTAGLAHITKNKFESSFIPIPPLFEQHRIIDRVEELFSRLDAGVEALKKAKVQLQRHRQAVLKAAVEGRLTEGWRKAHPEVEPAEKVLVRIQEERRMKLGKKYAPSKFDSESLPKLPCGWIWISIEQVALVETGATPLKSNPKYYDEGEIPWVTSGSLNDSFVTEADEFITELAIKETNAKVFPVNALLVAMYGEGKTRGKVSELLIEAATNQACAALLFEGTAETIRSYIKIFFEKNYEDIRRLSSGGVQPNLNLSIIKATKIPLPPLKELEFIVKEIGNNFTHIGEVTTILDQDLKVADRLRQSILKHAFKGRLIPQNPKDEPASMLLERIKAERSSQIHNSSKRNKDNNTHQMRLTQ